MREAPLLLKRAALSAWPREKVAGLVGADWHRFLDASADTDRFCSGVGALLDRLAYVAGPDALLSQQEAAAVLDATQFWLKRHRVPREED
jgi:Ca-activated chloride channel family protein